MTSTLAVVTWAPRRSIARIVVDGREVRVVLGQCGQRLLGGMALRLSSVMWRAPRSAR